VIARLDRLLIETLGPARGYAAFRLLSYLAVSAAALITDVAVYRLCLPLVGTAAMAAAIGFVFGIFAHYVVSSRVLFSDILKARGGSAEAPIVGQFFMAGGTGLLVTTLVVWLVADFGGYHPYAAKAVAVVFSFASVFALMRFVVLGNFLKRPAHV
jgi:putative flippase GtrA